MVVPCDRAGARGEWARESWVGVLGGSFSVDTGVHRAESSSRAGNIVPKTPTKPPKNKKNWLNQGFIERREQDSNICRILG